MKKLNFILLALFSFAFCSCNTKVDLYSDKGDSTVVYMMLDSDADTNFVKITKSFIGDATVLAQNYDACNYKIGEIDVKLVRMKKKVIENDTFQMHPIQKWLPYDQSSMFYSGCYQTYYYTAAKLISGETYKLVIKRNDGVVVTSTAKTIDNFEITTPNINSQEEDPKIEFTTNSNLPVKWRNKNTDGNFETNAAMFEVVAYFRYRELQPGATEWVDKELKWKFGSGTAESLFDTKMKIYSLSYTPQVLFNIIENDSYLKNNSPVGVKRQIKKMRYDVTAVGEELYNYLIINNSSSAIQDTPEYSNIENGIGLMSARVTHSRNVIVNQISRQKITNDFPTFGFEYDPNNPTD